MLLLNNQVYQGVGQIIVTIMSYSDPNASRLFFIHPEYIHSISHPRPSDCYSPPHTPHHTSLPAPLPILVHITGEKELV
jgi:hypothetical protein